MRRDTARTRLALLLLQLLPLFVAEAATIAAGTTADTDTSDGCDIGAVERGGNAKAPSALFLDGFELGHALRWSADAP
jgi:hypothetical protein